MFPPEIWYQIFDLATDVSSALDDQPYNLLHNEFGDDLRTRRGVVTEHYASLSLKCSLVRVCRAWRTLGIPYLYNDLRLYLEKTPEQIVFQLRMFANRTWGDEGEPIGRFTKRLEISWKYLQSGKDTGRADRPDMAVVQFLRTCPSLSVFKIDGWVSEVPQPRLQQLSAALADKPLRRMRFVHFGSIQLRPLYLLPTMVSLVLPFQDRVQDVNTALITLPNIRSIVFDCTANGTSLPVYTPNLHHLSFIKMNVGSRYRGFDCFLKLIPFFERNGAELLSLHMEYRFVRRDTHYPPRWGSLPSVLRYTPKLTELIFDLDYILTVVESLEEVSAALEGIQTLGLICHYEPDLKFVPSIKKCMPDLSTIRFSSVLDAAFCDSNSVTLTDLSRLGIRIEDRRGWALN